LGFLKDWELPHGATLVSTSAHLRVVRTATGVSHYGLIFNLIHLSVNVLYISDEQDGTQI
jgi:hypothetical protein